jgi:hypothetical protein
MVKQQTCVLLQAAKGEEANGCVTPGAFTHLAEQP